MSGKIKWMEHNGKKILFCDYSGLGVKETVELVDEIYKEIVNNTSITPLMLIGNMTGTAIPPKEARSKIKELGKLKKSRNAFEAMYGLTGVGKVVANIVQPGIFFCDTIEQAKEWMDKKAG